MVKRMLTRRVNTWKFENDVRNHAIHERPGRGFPVKIHSDVVFNIYSAHSGYLNNEHWTYIQDG